MAAVRGVEWEVGDHVEASLRGGGKGLDEVGGEGYFVGRSGEEWGVLDRVPTS